MLKLTMWIRAIMWMLWMGLYVLVAAWVGDGFWHESDTRLSAVIAALGWVLLGVGVIESEIEPKKLAKALLEDDQ